MDENNPLYANRQFEPGFPLPYDASLAPSPPRRRATQQHRLPLHPLSILTQVHPTRRPSSLPLPFAHLDPIPTYSFPDVSELFSPPLLRPPTPMPPVVDNNNLLMASGDGGGNDDTDNDEDRNNNDVAAAGQDSNDDEDDDIQVIPMDDDAAGAEAAAAAPPEARPNDTVLYENLSKLLECPVCLDNMRPGTRGIGFCKFGHITCQPCGNRIVANKPSKCPVCVTHGFEIVSHNYYAITLIDALAEMTVYTCQYPTCQQSLIGTFLQDHEKGCKERPLTCPRVQCKNEIPYYKLVNQTHPCLDLCRAKWGKSDVTGEMENVWEFTVELEDIFSVDQCKEHVSESFNPTLLLPNGQHALEDHSNHNKLCFNVMASNGVMFYLIYVDDKERAPRDLSQCLFLMSANCYTGYGKVGVYSRIQPVFYDTYIQRHTHGLALTRSDIYRYVIMTMHKSRPSEDGVRTHLPCKICPDARTPHLHIQIKQLLF